MKDALCEDAEMELEGTPIIETSSYVYLGHSMNMENDLREELNRRRRAAWASEGSHRPTDGPGASCPPVRLNRSPGVLLRG